MKQNHCSLDSNALAFNGKVKLSSALFAIVVAVSYLPLRPLEKLNESLMLYLSQIWWAVLLGLLLGGLIDYFVPEEFISGYLGDRSFISLLYAVLSGFVLSACSHGILALAMQLHKKGANNAAVVTFLLAAPWANLPVTILLFGFFGWKAILFIVAAMIIALITGSVFLMLEEYELIERSPQDSSAGNPSWERVKNFQLRSSINGVAKGTVQLSNMVLWWILIGVLMAALIGAFVPTHIFQDYFGPSLGGLALTLLVATIMEVCSEGSAPVAFELFNKTGMLGNPFVFLMAGVATDYTEVGLIWTNIGKRTALWLPVVTVPQVLLVGYLFNQFI
ncbi:MAG: permease [Bdellovibrionales bacterium]|nr:permease [Bdellovibrionales bacterium]